MRWQCFVDLTLYWVCRELAITEQTFHAGATRRWIRWRMGWPTKANQDGRAADLQRRLDEAERTIGALVLENDLRGKRCGG
jgi:hypothetical protein